MNEFGISTKLIAELLNLNTRKLRKRQEVSCMSCAYYREIDYEKFLNSLKGAKDDKIDYETFKTRIRKFSHMNIKDLMGLCVLRNERRSRTCRYFSHPVMDIEPEERLKYHTMHKERFYTSLNIGVSTTAILISILAIIFTYS